LIALDTSSLIAYLSGAGGPDVEATDLALQHRQAVLPPVVLSELLSDPNVDREVKDLFTRLPLLEVRDGYWHRAGLLRARLLGQGRKARLADTLIAQACLDHDVELVTRDGDFQSIARMAGLRLLIPVTGDRGDR
jgi:predicted nucleic acid-binding protein